MAISAILRLPFAPVLEREPGIRTSEMHRLLSGGLSPVQADQWATRVGAHPRELWGADYDHAWRIYEAQRALREWVKKDNDRRRTNRNRRNKKRGRPKTPTKHGTQWGYQGHGCRCELCRDAIRAHWKRRKRARAQRSVSAP